MIAAIVVIAGYFYFKSTDKSQEIVSQQTNQEEVAAAPDTKPSETEDEVLVDSLIRDGVISKVQEDGDTAKVYITSDFYRIPNVDKRNIFKVLLKDLQDKNPDVTSFTIYDDKSGDEVGTYDADGLKRK